MPSAIVLFSGGADSLLMLHWACMTHDKVIPLTYHYGQKHKKEIKFATELLQNQSLRESVHINHYQMDISGAFGLSNSKLLESTNKNWTPVGEFEGYPNVNAMHVPGRNGIFLTIAMGMAESMGIDEVWIGCDYSDRLGLFPDCYQEWIVKMNALAAINGSKPIRIVAPLLGFTKEYVTLMLKTLGYDLSKVYSGYEEPKK